MITNACTNQLIAEHIYDIINKYRKNPFQLQYDRQPIVAKLYYFIENKLPVKIILPACHGKAASPNSIISHYPDMGEYIGLNNFSNLCKEIAANYTYGCDFTLIHEGYFYSSTPIIGADEQLDDYLVALRKILNDYPHINLLTIKDFFPALQTNDERRAHFMQYYAPSLADIKNMIDKSPHYLNLYVNYKKLYAKYILPSQQPNVSRKARMQKIKELALNQLSIYHGFGKLVAEHFKTTPYLKFSALYKDPSITDQVAIDYINNTHHFATPLFFCVVKQKNGCYSFIRKADALSKGYQLKYHNDYAYFEEA